VFLKASYFNTTEEEMQIFFRTSSLLEKMLALVNGSQPVSGVPVSPYAGNRHSQNYPLDKYI